MASELNYEDFITFCKHFDDQNQYEFELEQIKELAGLDGNPSGYQYTTTYRDNSNYKSEVVIRLDQQGITWEVIEGWDDAHELLRQILDLVEESKALGLPRKYEFIITFRSCKGAVRMNRYEQEKRTVIEAASKLYEENSLIEQIEIYGEHDLHVWTTSEKHHCNEILN